jgi:hypothetical protein
MQPEKHASALKVSHFKQVRNVLLAFYLITSTIKLNSANFVIKTLFTSLQDNNVNDVQ